MQENLIKKAVREDRVAVGTTLGTFGTREMPHILNYAKLDWVMIDMEHSGYTVDTIADLIGWFKATPITVIIRPPDNLYHLLSGLMDVGAAGVMVAHIDTAADARRAVDAVMYPPLGHRGVGLNSLHANYTRPKSAEYFPLANAQTSVIAMIEGPEGLENVDEIAAVEGVDIVQASHYDLSAALGIPEDFQNPTFRSAIAKVAAACTKHKKAFKFNPHSDADTAELYALGCRVMGVQEPVVTMQEGVKANAEHMRSQIAKLSKR
jgi:2-keto-3-deoxy-L-rhamnonate aldolase RhmA